MRPREIKTVLTKIGGGANKRLGQHFLIDDAVLKAMTDVAGIKPGDRVLEIGPGLGVLTRALIGRGAEVIAIERDRRFAERLLADEEWRGAPLRVVHGDAATIHWHEIIGDRPWKFVSNLPYGITSLALRKALWAPKPPEVAVVMVQREVAERAIAKDGKTSLLSLMVAFASSEARIVRRVPSGAFYPPPKVDSAVLRIVPMPWEERRRRWGADPGKIMDLARRGFAHPRKLLVSNLGFSVAKPPAGWPASLSITSRAEDLSPEQWAALTPSLDRVFGFP